MRAWRGAWGAWGGWWWVGSFFGLLPYLGSREGFFCWLDEQRAKVVELVSDFPPLRLTLSVFFLLWDRVQQVLSSMS
ncbi:hypothetical protein B0T16DRAFT_422004, partial [Cercophora newfieldiana]